MTLTSKLDGKNKRDKEFREILLSVEPDREDYYTLSNNTPFSNEYTTIVPNVLSNPRDSSLVGIAFDYLARFRIAQFIKAEEVIRGLSATSGFKKLRFPDEHENAELFYSRWGGKVLEFIKDDSMPISQLFEIAVHFAKLEQIARARINRGDINIEYLLFEPAQIEVINDLNNLMVVFEETFMIPEIINKKSKVVFNPNFGVGSLLVSGADADIFIDGTLYDFKTSKEKNLQKKDNLQMIGYYLLNELAIVTLSDDIGFDYVHLDIKKIAFYKGRFGEIEYYDVNKHLPYKDVKPKLTEIAEHFKEKQGSLHLAWRADLDAAKRYLEEIRNGKI